MELLRRMIVSPYAGHVVMVTMIMVTLAPALTGHAASGMQNASDPRLKLQLSEALQAFDSGSKLMRRAPDEARTAFRIASDKFHALVNAGVENGELFYDMGNTHLRLGEIGEAIADYRRAERLIPGNERLRANLRFARSLRRDRIEAGGKRALLQTVFFWHYSMPLSTRKTATMVGYGVFWLLLIVKVLSPRLRLGYPVFASMVLGVAMAISVVIGLPSRTGDSEGVLVASDVVVRKGNGEGYEPRFKQPLAEGVEFKVVERRSGWIRIELADGNRGWVREPEVELF